MSDLQFVLAGDLDENKSQRLQNPQALFQERCHPLIMTVKQDKKETRIGRKNSRVPPDYTLESALSNRMISRNHVTIERLSKGNYMLYDHSLNGTYVNFCRVIGGTILKNDDIVCFGHINGANIKPGESVTPFNTDLKYRVEIIEKSLERPSNRSENYSDSSEEESESKVHSRPVESKAYTRPVVESKAYNRPVVESKVHPRPVIESKVHTRPIVECRKKVKSKPISDQSSQSSDSSDLSNENPDNNYLKRKNVPITSSSSSEDDHFKQSNKDRHMHKKVIPEKLKNHSSSLQNGRSNDIARNKKNIPENVTHKLNYSKKPIESKKPKLEDDRRVKDRKIQMSNKSQPKNKFSDTKSAKRNSNGNSNYDYEECSARPCLRPDSGSIIDWIMCDRCNQWFHHFCVGLREALDDDENYYCPYCAKNCRM